MGGRRCLYLEPIGGIAGDMFLASALDLGVALADLERPLRTLALAGWRFEAQKSVRHHITGTHLDVVVDEGAQPERTYREVKQLIESSGLSTEVKRLALAVFAEVARAEAKVHDAPLEEVHFHEVGAVDSIVDICGAAVVLECLGFPKVFAAPPPLGSGTVKTAHGMLPVPAPATLEILRDVPVRFEGRGELTTPTGAALVKVLSQVGTPPELTVEKVGYGVGTRDFPDRANVLRVTLAAQTSEASSTSDATYVLETNLDDCSPQWLGALTEALLEAGALDVAILPATMKKGRPGHLLTVLAAGDRKDALVGLLLSDSTTLGVRCHRVERVTLERRWVEVSTAFGKVRIKVGERHGRMVNAMPEFDDCLACAKSAGVPVKSVWTAAIAAFEFSKR